MSEYRSAARIEVLSRGRTLEHLANRPLRKLPSGTSGVVYQGKVYPLHVGDRIDADEPGIRKTECSRFIRTDEPVVYAPALTGGERPLVERWSVETNKHGHYVVFDATEPVAERLVAAFVDSGLGVIRWDSSHRPAADGYHYDWFIRLAFTGSRTECLPRVEAVLAGEVSTPTQADAEPIAERLTALEHRLSQVRHLVDDLAEQRDAAVALTQQTESELAAALTTIARLRREKKQAAQRAQRAETDAARAAANAAENNSLPSAERAELERRVLEAKHRADAIEKIADEYFDELADLQPKLAMSQDKVRLLQDQIDDLNALRDEQIAQLARRSDVPPRGPGIWQRLWPRLVLHQRALEFLEDPRRCPEAEKLCEVLTDLNRRAKSGRRFQSTEHVWEVREHIRIEKSGSNAGRVYYRILPDERLWILIDRKDPKSQTQLGQWFDNLDLPDDDY
ncbi:hypothetical protein [Cellulomonas uda]|uniref:Uncharacterized protein n=1 Tax=Cellulomonas uda TaxID=1714 RepID=A0A4Y3KBW2_CELUD|nr:hypothetical protein [Cellulomonas uda]NII66242.1 hypothetical protein [Cellulomonas uda]GEA81949.1 hypothetical protein CUD01_23930 [Cellulomonas uda]